MKRALRLLLTVLMLSIPSAQLLFSQRAAAQAQSGTTQQPREYQDIPVNIETPIQPTPVKGTDGKWYLVYHLFLTNWSFADLTLKSVEVSDAEQGRILARYADKIASGRTGVLFFWLTAEAQYLLPSTLSHRFTFAANPLIKLLSYSAPGDSGGMVLAYPKMFRRRLEK